MPSKDRFSSLLSAPPTPIPDDEEAAPEGEREPKRASSTRRLAAASEARPATAPRHPAQPKVQPPRTEAHTPEVIDEPTPAPTPAPTATSSVATTVRLRPSAAEPLNAAWLDERRRNNPKLSYPEFASMIVSLGLAAYQKQRPASASTVAVWQCHIRRRYRTQVRQRGSVVR